MFHMFFSTYADASISKQYASSFDVPGFELSRFYSIAATSKKLEQCICFKREHVQIITFTQMFFG